MALVYFYVQENGFVAAIYMNNINHPFELLKLGQQLSSGYGAAGNTGSSCSKASFAAN